MNNNEFDAVVIGSGFGGSVMAYRLAEAGWSVCLLERGKSYPPFSFPRAPFKLRNNFWEPNEGLFGMYNVWSFRDSGALVSAGLGGGSLIYANIIIRKDEKWFVRDIDKGGYENWVVTRADLDPHYDNVDRMMNVQKYPLTVANPYKRTPKTLAMKEAAAKLKEKCKHNTVEWLPLNLAVSFRQRPVGDPDNPDNLNNPPLIGEPIYEEEGKKNIHGRTRYTCVLCGECDLGCNTGSKNTLDYTYITAAYHSGADVRTLCEVKSFAPKSDGSGYTVTYLKYDPKNWETKPCEEFTITCKRLIISAGTFGSPYLLLKNRGNFPNISKTLGERYCVNGDLLSFIVNSQEKKNGKCVPRVLDPSFGPVITSAIRLGDTLDNPDFKQGRGFYVEDGGNPYLLSWAAELTGFGNALIRLAKFGKSFFKYRLGLGGDADLDSEIAHLIGDCATSKSSLPVLTMGRDIANGRLYLDKNGYLECDWNIEKSQEYYDRVVNIVSNIAGALNAEYMDNPSYKFFKQVLTAHPLGGAAMGRDASEGVVNSCGEVFGYPGLYVMDGSILPGPVGPNPSMTIAAVSDRAAEFMIEGRECKES